MKDAMSLAQPAPPHRLSWMTIAIIVIGNLVPIAGVLFLGWSAVQILLIYWVENLIVGVFTVPRILSAKGDATETNRESSVGLAVFFTLHYFFFCMGHGVFAFILANDLVKAGDAQPDVWAQSFGSADFRLAILAAFIVQAVLFLRGWVLAGLWRTAKPNTEMFRPYGRIVVLHVTVLIGAWSMLELGAPASTVLILCVGKMVLELATEFAISLIKAPVKAA